MMIINHLVVILSLYSSSSLRILPASKELHRTELDYSLDMMGPLEGADVLALEGSGLREPITKRLKAMHTDPKEHTNFFFIGDSIVRNQFQGLCLILMGQDAYNAKVFGKFDNHCEDENISAHYTTKNHLDETAVSSLIQTSGRQPSAIYWDAAYHSVMKGEEHTFDDYPSLISKTVESYGQKAPEAKLVFFLSHAVCTKPGAPAKFGDSMFEKVDTLNKQAQTALNGLKDGQGRPVKMVDGWSFTLDRQMCALTTDGRHWNTKVWDELNMFLDAIEQ